MDLPKKIDLTHFSSAKETLRLDPNAISDLIYRRFPLITLTQLNLTEK